VVCIKIIFASAIDPERDFYFLKADFVEGDLLHDRAHVFAQRRGGGAQQNRDVDERGTANDDPDCANANADGLHNVDPTVGLLVRH
jgi:hypothetical protein